MPRHVATTPEELTAACEACPALIGVFYESEDPDYLANLESNFPELVTVKASDAGGGLECADSRVCIFLEGSQNSWFSDTPLYREG